MGNEMKEYIEDTVKKIISSYKKEVPRIRSEYNHENELIGSYKGREVLELIQNAEDELTDDLPKEVYISFDGETLTIANYGNPFTFDGIESLMYSNNSAKIERKKKVIGNKGTGFRSILGWAETITIHSGNLHIQFSEKHSQDILRNVVFEGKKVPNKLKAATLVFPEWIDSFKSKYTTVISIKVKKNEDVINDIREQLNNLNCNLLLFLNNTLKLSVEVEGDITCFKKSVVDENIVKLLTKKNNEIIYEKEWLLNKKEGQIEDEFYSIVIAYDLEGNFPDKPYIYTYFQTDVRFPFPVLLHADFNLNADRNHLLKNNEHNKKILEDAAELLVDTSIKVFDKGVSYKRIEFLIPNGDIEAELENYNFIQLLYSKMRDAEIFPTVNQKYVSYNDELKFFENGLSKYLSGSEFSDLLMYSDSRKVINLLKYFGFRDYLYQDISYKIDKWVKSRKVTNENIRKVAYTSIKFIERFSGDYYFKWRPELCPSFFYNNKRKLIGKGKSIFLLDEGYQISKPPKFANIEFMDPYMRSYYYKQFKDEDYGFDEDIIIEKLGQYNVREYNVNELLEHINEILYSKIENGKKKDAKDRWETLIKWLWNNRKVLFDEEINVDLYFATRSGDLNNASGLYYGKEYGNEVGEELIGSYAPELLICDLREYIEETSNEELLEFIKKIGIVGFPRMYEEKRFLSKYFFDKEYLFHVFSDASYPLVLDNLDKFDDVNELYRRISRVNITRTEIENLEDILHNSSTSSILKWIELDTKLQNHLYSQHESQVMSVEVVWDFKRNSKPIATIKNPYSYIYYLFSTIPWIEVDGRRYSIQDCLLGLDTKGVDLSDYLVNPDISSYIKGMEGAKGKLKKAYYNIFDRMQVKKDFSELSIEKIYQVLNYLPTVEGADRLAQTFYRNIIDNAELNYSEEELECDEYETFKLEGKILTNNGFKPIDDCYYLDGRDICEKVAKSYNLICIPKKRNKDRIKKMFCVEQLKLVGQLKGAPVIHKEQASFANDFKEYKVLAFAYRLDKVKGVKDEVRKFSNIDVKICSLIKASYKTNKEENAKEIELDDYEYILDGNSTYYLKVPETLTFKEMKNNMQLSYAIANIFSSYLDVDDVIEPFKALYYIGDSADREMSLYQTFDDDKIVQKCRKTLSFDEDTKEEFLDIICKLSEKPREKFERYAKDIDFDDLLDYSNAIGIIRIFDFAGINVDDYNSEDPSIYINLVDYFKQEIKSLKNRYEKKYKITWFKKLEKAMLTDKINLVANFQLLDSFEIRIDNDIYYEPENEIIKQLEIDTNLEDIDLVGIYNQNLLEWKKGLEDSIFVDGFMNLPENMSLVYYGEFDELNNRYGVYYKENTADEEEQKTIEPENNVGLIEYNVETKPYKRKAANVKRRTTTGYSQNKTKKIQEKVGRKGELLVYRHLLADNTKTNITWVSENAKKEGVNPEGSAGYGYDISFIDSDGTLKYVEVKASKASKEDGIRFYMSDNEYDFARKNADNYLVYYVCSIGLECPQLLVFDDVFERSSFNKKNYAIESTSEYTITAKIK